MSAANANAPPPVRGRGVTLLAALLVASPLLQWAYLSALAQFTILEPPLTAARGLPLAMQLFFAPGNIIAVVLGAGLLLRSEWTRRIALAVFAITLALAGWAVGNQVAASRYDSNVLLAGLSLALSVLYVWYFCRARVRAEFRRGDAKRQPAAPQSAATGAVAFPRALTVAALGEVALGIAAAALVAYLYKAINARPLLDVGPGIGVVAADDLLRALVFVALALLLSPHALSAYASVVILLGRDRTRAACRYATMGCWSTIGCALVTWWLATREGFAFDLRGARLLYAFCASALAWHAFSLYAIARYRAAAP